MIDTKMIRIKIWDTAEQERYKALIRCFFQKAQGVIIVFDVTNQKTFSDLQYWIESMNSHLYDDIDSIPVIIIGNKIDLPKRIVIKETAEKYAKDKNYNYYETSAKTGEGIDNAIKELARKVINNGGKKNGKDNLRLSKVEKKSKCCWK